MRRPRADRPDQLREKRAAQHRDVGVGVALERVERERDTQRRAVTEKRALRLGQAQRGEIGRERGLLHPGEPAVALEQRPEPRVGERVGVASGVRRRGGRARLALGLALARAPGFAAFHAASTAMSTSARGRRSTCATSVMARTALVKPVSFTSSPYSGCRPAGSSGDRKSTRLNSSHITISYAVFCLKKKK